MSFFSFTKLENRKVQQVLPVGVGTIVMGDEVQKDSGGLNMV
jgi:hypothetical protein